MTSNIYIYEFFGGTLSRIECYSLMHQFHMLGVAGVFGGFLFSTIYDFLIISGPVPETTENESTNA